MLVAKLTAQPLYACHVSRIPYGEYMRQLTESLLVVDVSRIIPSLISLRFAAPTYYSLAEAALISFIC